ncbi:MAG: hypothetical protein WD872_04945 [Pirellulaceae bacterium]
MTQSAEETALVEALAKLETALLAPLISGELESWASAVGQGAGELEPSWTSNVKNILQPQYAEIARSDQELLSRVESLIAEDEKLGEAFDAFRGNAQDFCRRAPAARKDENKVAEQQQALVKQGLDLVTGIRRQQVAASAWLAESLYRDRGPVD